MEDEDVLFLFIGVPGFFLFAILSFVVLLLAKSLVLGVILFVIALVFLAFGFREAY